MRTVPGYYVNVSDLLFTKTDVLKLLLQQLRRTLEAAPFGITIRNEALRPICYNKMLTELLRQMTMAAKRALADIDREVDIQYALSTVRN